MRESGELTVIGPNGTNTVPTLKCVHCGRHWVPEPGSGRVRGFCTRCMGPVCGAACTACVPYEKQIEQIERGLRA